MDKRQSHLTSFVGLKSGRGELLIYTDTTDLYFTLQDWKIITIWTTWIWDEHVADCLEGTGMRKAQTSQERWMSPYTHPPIRNQPNHRSGERKLFLNGKVIMYVVHVCGGQRVETTVDKGLLQGKPNKTLRTSGLTTLWIQRFKVKRQLGAVEGQDLPGSWRESWEGIASMFASASYPGVT